MEGTRAKKATAVLVALVQKLEILGVDKQTLAPNLTERESRQNAE